MHLRYIPLLLVSILTTSTLTAQNPDNNTPFDRSQFPGLPPAIDGDILCRCVSTFLLDKNEVLYFKIDNTYHKVDLGGEGISLPFPVRGSTTFSLYKKNPPKKGPDGKDKPLFRPVVQQSLVGDGKNFLVILHRKEINSPIKSKAYNISKANRPADNIYLFNESPVAIGLQVIDTQGVINANKEFKYGFSNASRKTYTSAKIIMRYKGEKRVMASKRLRLVPGRRIILVCYLSKSRAKLGATPLSLVTYQDKP